MHRALFSDNGGILAIYAILLLRKDNKCQHIYMVANTNSVRHGHCKIPLVGLYVPSEWVWLRVGRRSNISRNFERTKGVFCPLCPKRNGTYFPNDNSKCIFVHESFSVLISFSLKFVLWVKVGSGNGLTLKMAGFGCDAKRCPCRRCSSRISVSPFRSRQMFRCITK